MNFSNHTPCSDWVQKLSARHLDDLTPSERIALKEHLAMCRACHEVHMDYQTLESGIRSLLACEEAAFISQPCSKRVRRTPRAEIMLPDLPSLFLSMFASRFVSICLSKLHLQLHYWLLLIPSLFSHKIAYVLSSSHNLYAIRPESGFIVWKQKRYEKHNPLYTVPARMIGMNCFSCGTALLSAYDFCRYTARA